MKITITSIDDKRIDYTNLNNDPELMALIVSNYRTNEHWIRRNQYSIKLL